MAAAPGRVWGALTQQDELARWWANEARVKPEVGSLAEFRFRQFARILALPL
ncbi:MAG TPA: SRPBCC domain-containing protein [Ktedonobacteraceae bacterium]|nr:SRPBCC domain-containing protein [Ktedonobacteraceae bacterium]